MRTANTTQADRPGTPSSAAFSPRLAAVTGLDRLPAGIESGFDLTQPAGAEAGEIASSPSPVNASSSTTNTSTIMSGSTVVANGDGRSSSSMHSRVRSVAPSPSLSPFEAAITSSDSSLNSFTKLSLDEYVKSKGGNRIIRKILIANNGIAAVKAIRSMRRWAYETFGNDHVLEFVVMATPEDLKANAAYIHLADEFVQVPGGSNNNNYANIRLIVDIAERTGCDGVWPGWGHASENDRLPEMLALTPSKIVWIGPPPQAMRALGDKIGSTLIAQSAGVPCMSWSGSGLEVQYAKNGLPKDLYERACVHSTAEAIAASERIGFPIMIKASEGGGGKGIRKVENKEEIELAFPQVQGEVPGSPIFLMKLASGCRHLEVQLLADRFHNAIAVFGRDCSIQRRHQKIIEEGPVVAAPPKIWRDMEKSAVRLAKEVGYVGAGTVEYLYNPDGTYCFLELNPRLQVEHPVTELISGVNLPAAQLQVAMGIPLHNVRGVRRMYGEAPDDSTPIDFDNRDAKTLPGHVIACRITAENPDASFQPTSGAIQELNFRATPDVWGYFSVGAKGGIHEYSDSQFGHLFALGETREIARRNMVLALRELSIRGDIRTTVEYLQQILETDDFRNNNLSTTWLERLMSKRAVITEKPPVLQTVVLGAIWRTFKLQQSRMKEYMNMLERGQLPPPSLHNDLIHHELDLIYDKVKYHLIMEKSSPHSFDVTIGNKGAKEVSWGGSVDTHTLTDEGLLCILLGKKHVVYGQEFPSGLRLVVDGKTCLFHEEYDPTQLRSTMPGKLVRFLVADGDHVSKDKPYAEIEVMKMYITLAAPEDGVIKTLKPEGSIIEAGDLLASLALDHPERVQKAELFTGKFNEPSTAVTTTAVASKHESSTSAHPNQSLKETHRRLLNLLGGYALSSEGIKNGLQELLNALRAPALPLEQFREALSTIISRIPANLAHNLTTILDRYASSVAQHRFAWESPEEFPVLDLQNAIERALLALPSEEERTKVSTSLNASGITQLLQLYKLGNHGYAIHVLFELLEDFYAVEQHYVDDASHGSASMSSASSTGGQAEFVIKKLRRQFKDEGVEAVARVARAHHQLSKRSELIVLLLELLHKQLAPLLPSFRPILKKLATLNSKECGSVVLAARQLIMSTELPSSAQRKIAIQTLLSTASSCHSSEQRRERLAPLIDQSQPIEDLIFQCFEHKRSAIQTAAMEAYIRRIFQVYYLPFVDCQVVKPNMLMGKSGSGDASGSSTGGLKLRIDGTNEELSAPILLGRWHFSMDQTSRALEMEQHANAKLPVQGSPSPSPATVGGQSWSPAAGGASSASGLSPSQNVRQTSAGRPPLATTSSSGQQQQQQRSVVSGRQMQSQYLLRKSDSVSDVRKLRRGSSKDSASATSTEPTAEEDEALSEEEEASKSAEGETVPAGSAAASFTTLATSSPRQPRGSIGGRPSDVRQGVLGYFTSFDSMKRYFAELLPFFDTRVQFVEPIHVLYVGFRWGAGINIAGSGAAKMPPDDTLSTYLRTFLSSQEKALVQAGVRRVTFIVTASAEAGSIKEESPAIFTFRHRLNYEEDTLVRHIEPITAAQLDLERLSNFDLAHLSTTNRAVHLFAAYPAKVPGKGVALHGDAVPPTEPIQQATASVNAYDGRRFFIRTLVRKLDGGALFQDADSSSDGPTRGGVIQTPFHSGAGGSSSVEGYSESDLDAYPETEFAFVEALNALEIAMAGDATRSPFKFNSIFLNVLVEAIIDVKYIEAVIRLMARRYASKIKRLHVAVVEFNICIKPPVDDAHADSAMSPASASAASIAYRFIATNPTGYNLLVDTYQERKDPTTGKIFFKLVHNHDQHGRSMVYDGAQQSAESMSSSLSSFSWDGLEVSTPYPVSTPFQKQRQVAASMETVYVYDFLPLIEHAISKQWKLRYRALKYAAASAGQRRPSIPGGPGSLFAQVMMANSEHSSLPEREHAYAELKGEEEARLSSFMPHQLLKAVELVLDTDPTTGRPTLVQKHRAPGHNNIGMVAWLLTLYTPELVSAGANVSASSSSSGASSAAKLLSIPGSSCPGRQVVLIANDITFQAGTFGPQEDLLFDLASKYARQHGIPRWYFSANSGARIGLADELRQKFKVAWQDGNPLKGFAYLYVSEEDYPALAKSVVANRTEVEVSHADGSKTKEVRYVLHDIIGARDGLGVENLRGSGTIAGETSAAYDNIYTLTYVTSRTVGIGAYLARLGQRVIQKHNLPIILTGFSALNKLLGKQVYTSNVQLGGTDIMFTNGVSHLTVYDDMEGVMACLNWLSYVPVRRGYPLPMLMPAFNDPIARDIGFTPTKAPYDVRNMLAGVKGVNEDGSTSVWQSGFLDRDSWTELLSGWAKTVVVGRGRLGGMPVGVIAVETRTVEEVIPADPAAPDSKEQVLQRAGQVWYPNSSFKTAQAINDLDAEDLPLIIFANWRGFSGGQQDMFEEVLKFGSYIVDALRKYKQPVMVYLPPHATLRGGAWVVVDSTINEAWMEMYADETARGGVLETEGTLDVKFRKKDILAAAHRLDDKLKALDAELKAVASVPLVGAAASSSSTGRSRDVILKEIAARERLLFPMYHQVAAHFADLHDTPGRMQAKGCIRGTVAWPRSREYFYHRIRRKVEEGKWKKRIQATMEETDDKDTVDSADTLNIPAPTPVHESWREAQALLAGWVSTISNGSIDLSSASNSSDEATYSWLAAHTNEIEAQFQSWRSNKLLNKIRRVVTKDAQHQKAATGSGAAQTPETDATVTGLASIISSLTEQQKAALKKLVA